MLRSFKSSSSFLGFSKVAKHSFAPAEAAQLYEQILLVEHVFPEAHQNLATLYEHFGKVDLALHHHQLAYDQSLRLHYPLSTQIQLRLNIISLQLRINIIATDVQIQQWIEECERLRQTVVEINQNASSSSPERDTGSQLAVRKPLELLFTLGLLYQRIENHRQAVYCFQTIINEHDYDHTLSWLNIGNYFFQIRDYPQAIHYYSIALEITMEQIDRQLLSLHPEFSQMVTATDKTEAELQLWKQRLLTESKNRYRLHPSLRSEYYMITSIANNLGQSYRENGAFEESIRTFLYGNDHATLLHYMNHPDTLSLITPSTSLLQPASKPQKLSTANLYFLITIFMMKAFLNHWQEYEVLETLLLQQVRYSQSLFIQAYQINSIAPAYNLLLQANSNEKGSSIFDPYTLSLLRYASSEFDLFVTQQNCPMKLYQTDSDHPVVLSRPESRGERGERWKENDKQSRSKIRVGYLSYDWRDHPMGRLTAGIVTATTTTSYPEVEIYCFSYGYNDLSEVRRFVSRYCQQFFDVSRITTDVEIARVIASHQIDLLIDITSHTYHNRMPIMSYRPASVLINYLGYPGSTGCISNAYHSLDDHDITTAVETALSQIHYPIWSDYDYSIVDRQVIPPDYLIQRSTFSGHAHSISSINTSNNATSKTSLYYRTFSEQLVYLPYSYQSNYMPLSILFPLARPTPPLTRSTTTLCVLNAHKKFEPTFFQTLTNLLQSHPWLRLRFLDVADQSQQQLRRQFAYYGINSSSNNRISFLNREPWQFHLSRITRDCEGVLDTFVYGGHTTSTDVLWMGLPIFTMRGYGLSQGVRMPSRVAASLVTQLDQSTDEREEEEATNKLLSISLLTAVDTIKDYENVITRFLTVHQRAVVPHESGSLLRVVQQQLLRRSCSASIFDLSLMRQTLNQVYQILYEQQLLIGSKPEKRYHIVLTKGSYDQRRKQATVDYCQTETSHWLQTRENNDQSLSFHTAEKETPLHLIAILQRLKRGGSSHESNKALQFALSRRLQTLVRRRLEILFEASEDTNRETGLSNVLIEDIIELQQLSAFHAPTTEEYLLWVKYLVEMYITVLKQLSFEDLLEANQNNMITIDLVQRVVIDRFMSFKRVIPLLLISNQTLLSFISEEQHVMTEIALLSQLFEAVTSIFVDLNDRNEPLLLPNHMGMLEIINWNWDTAIEDFVREGYYISQETASLNPYHLTSRQQRIYDVLLQSVLSRMFTRCFPDYHSDSDNSSSFPFIPIAYRWKSFLAPEVVNTIRPLLLERFSYHSLLLSSLTNARTESLLPTFFRHSVQLLLLSPGLHAIEIFHLGIHWTEIIKSLTHHKIAVKEDYYLLGYTLQSIGSRLVMAEKRLDPSYHYQAERENFVKTLEAVNRAELPYRELFDQNPILVIYGYEYEQQWWPGWGPSSLPSHYYQTNLTELMRQHEEIHTKISSPPEGGGGKAMGGSEEAVIYLTSELMKLGYSIEIYTSDLALADQGFTAYSTATNNRIGRVQWYHYLQYNSSREDIDIFISWRYALSLPLGKRAKQSWWLWLHDLVPSEALPPLAWLFGESDYLTGILTQSSFHQQFIVQQYDNRITSHNNTLLKRVQEKVKILPNGVHLPSIQSSLPRKPHVLVYSSAPSRGLDIVLTLWPSILQLYPTAELWIFYGFTAPVISRLQQQMGLDQFHQWYDQIQTLLRQPQIVYFGAVDHLTLHHAFLQSSFLLYPSAFPETGCITMMKAMMAGVIPITSHYQSSVLATLGEEFDLGPGNISVGEEDCREDCALTDAILQNQTRYREWIVRDYLQAVVRAMELVTTEEEEVVKAVERLRTQMAARMTEKYSWAKSAKRFVEYNGIEA